MSYGYVTEEGSWPEEPNFFRMLFWFIPRANPDIQALLPQVRHWALELNSIGKPIREVGLGENDKILFRAPDRRNRGYWTDSPILLNEIEFMDKDQFENLWKKAPNNHA